MRSSPALRLMTVLSMLAVPSGSVFAQRYWFDDQGRDAVHLDVLYPFLKGSTDRFFTGVFLPSASFRIGEGFRLEGDLPMMRAGFHPLTGPNTSNFRIGNPYVGLRIGDDQKLVSGLVGMRVALGQTPKDAAGGLAVAAGSLAYPEDFEAFTPPLLTIRGGVELRRLRKDGLLLGLRGGSSLLINTGGNPTDESNLYFDYGARIGYEGPRAQATVALTGRYLINPNSPENFDQRSRHSATGTVELRPGPVRPRATLKIPFDKVLRDDSGATLGVGVSIAHK
jgi:hypothetical protein